MTKSFGSTLARNNDAGRRRKCASSSERGFPHPKLARWFDV
jgi:hypothetical protein